MTYALAPSMGPMGLYSPAPPANDVTGLGSADWHGPDDIQTLEGLAGTYLWMEDLGFMTRITFVFNPMAVGWEGTYTIHSGFAVTEQGEFRSVPNNPAVGFAHLILRPADPMALRAFLINGMVTDANWKVLSLYLQRLGDTGPVPPEFWAVRLFP